MKIGILIDRLNVGGVEKIAIEEVIALRREGIDATLVILRQKSLIEGAFDDILKDVPVVYLDARLPRFLRGSFRVPGFLFFSWFHISYPFLIPFVVKPKEFDYLITHGTYTAFSAIALRKRRNIPFSVFIWDPITYILDRVYTDRWVSVILKVIKIVARRFDHYILNQTDVILAGGHAHDPIFHELNPDKEIVVIYPSVHPAAKQVKKQPYAVMVTAWKEGKHPEYAFTLLEKLPRLKIKMVGKWIDPVYRATFEAEMNRRGLTNRLDIVGGVSEKQLSHYYASATVLLQTNDDRGFALPALEAASQGTTFIIPKGQGVCDLFTDGVHGFYTKEQETKKITSLLKKLLDNPTLAKTMGSDAMKKVHNNYTWQNHAKQLIELVDKLKS